MIELPSRPELGHVVSALQNHFRRTDPKTKTPNFEVAVVCNHAGAYFGKVILVSALKTGVERETDPN